MGGKYGPAVGAIKPYMDKRGISATWASVLASARKRN